MDPPDPTWESFDAWQFTINLFSTSWGPFENVNLPFFLFKMQIWNDCNALNIAGNCIKDINVNLSFLSLGSKLWNGPPWPNMRMFWNSTFACTVQWCMTIYHKPFSISWGPLENVNLPFFLFKMQIRSDCNALNIAGYQCKSFISQFRIKSCGMDPPDPTWEIFEILLLHVLSNDAWQFTINLFSISWGPFENVNLPFFSIQNADLKWL